MYAAPRQACTFTTPWGSRTTPADATPGGTQARTHRPQATPRGARTQRQRQYPERAHTAAHMQNREEYASTGMRTHRAMHAHARGGGTHTGPGKNKHTNAPVQHPRAALGPQAPSRLPPWLLLHTITPRCPLHRPCLGFSSTSLPLAPTCHQGTARVSASMALPLILPILLAFYPHSAPGTALDLSSMTATLLLPTHPTTAGPSVASISFACLLPPSQRQGKALDSASPGPPVRARPPCRMCPLSARGQPWDRPMHTPSLPHRTRMQSVALPAFVVLCMTGCCSWQKPACPEPSLVCPFPPGLGGEATSSTDATHVASSAAFQTPHSWHQLPEP